MRRTSRHTLDLGPEGKPWARLYVDFVLDGATKRSRPKEIEIAALRFVALDSERRHGEATFRLGDFFRRLDAIKSQLEQDIAREAKDVNLDLTWLQGELSLDERLTILRDDHNIRARSGELVASDVRDSGPEKMLSLSQAAEYAGVSVGDLKDLERQGLLVCRKTNGGRRRYSVDQLREAKSLLKTARGGKRARSDLKIIRPARPSVAFDHADEPMAAMGMPTANRGKSLTSKERRHLTVITVAQLYLMAFFRYPEREGSVIDFIRSEMEWLSASQVTTYVRQARHRSGIPLPIFRQGRIREPRLSDLEAQSQGVDRSAKRTSKADAKTSPGREDRVSVPVPVENSTFDYYKSLLDRFRETKSRSIVT